MSGTGSTLQKDGKTKYCHRWGSNLGCPVYQSKALTTQLQALIPSVVLPDNHRLKIGFRKSSGVRSRNHHDFTPHDIIVGTVETQGEYLVA